MHQTSGVRAGVYLCNCMHHMEKTEVTCKKLGLSSFLNKMGPFTLFLLLKVGALVQSVKFPFSKIVFYTNKARNCIECFCYDLGSTPNCYLNMMEYSKSTKKIA